jgi:thioredoxin 1
MKRLLIIGIAAILFAGPSVAQTSAPAAASVGKNTVTTKTKPKAKKKTVKPDSTKPKEVKLPKLVDLGADKCIPCKMMAPILEELKKEYPGKLDVVFIDVWKNSGEGETYKIRVIPTQIFYGSDGKELFRHEGFFAKEDILAKWKEFGYDLRK